MIKKWIKRLAKLHALTWLSGAAGTAVLGHAYMKHHKKPAATPTPAPTTPSK